MVRLVELVSYADQLLESAAFQDYCPNGLQVEGRAEVHRLVSGVPASLALLDAAIAREADAILVHHGYFWKGESPVISGIKYRRLQRLINAGVSLIAYHLPLDAHPGLGNNAQLARRLGLTELSSSGPGLVMQGSLPRPLSIPAFCERLTASLARAPLHIPGTSKQIHRIAWCTGAAQDYLEAAAASGVDAYLTGEISERTVHIARECGIHFYAAGHHATERYGVQALGEHLAEHFPLHHEFIDIDCPV